MKKIFILDESESSKKNGIGTYTKQLILCFKPIAKVCIVSFNSTVKELTITKNKGVQQIMFPPFLNGNFTSNKDIVSVIFKTYIDDDKDNIIIVNHSPCSDFLSKLKETLPNSKIIFIIHDLGWTKTCLGNKKLYTQIIKSKNEDSTKERYSFIINRYEEELKIYKLSDKIVCLCNETQRLLNELYNIDKEKTVTIPNGLLEVKKLDKIDVRKELFLDNDEKILLFTGRLVNNKGIKTLFSAFEKILYHNHKTRMVLAGMLSHELEEQLSLYPNIVSKITITGFLPKKTLQKWYSVADIGIIPSYYEQCSYSGIEMMMNGLPIITTNGYGLNNMFHNGINAVVVDLNKNKTGKYIAMEFADKIIELLDSEPLCQNYRIKAYETFEKNYKLKYMRKAYIKLISEI